MITVVLLLLSLLVSCHATTVIVDYELGSITLDYGFTNTVQTFTVPAGVSSIEFEISGGSGGSDSEYNLERTKWFCSRRPCR